MVRPKRTEEKPSLGHVSPSFQRVILVIAIEDGELYKTKLHCKTVHVLAGFLVPEDRGSAEEDPDMQTEHGE